MPFLNKKNRARINTIVLTLFSTIMPVVVFAAPNIETILLKMRQLVGSLLPVVVGLALVYFFWGLAMFVLHAGDESKRAEGRQIMIWGIITLFVMVSVWGLVAVLASTFSVTSGGAAPPLPTI